MELIHLSNKGLTIRERGKASRRSQTNPLFQFLFNSEPLQQGLIGSWDLPGSKGKLMILSILEQVKTNLLDWFSLHLTWMEPLQVSSLGFLVSSLRNLSFAYSFTVED